MAAIAVLEASDYPRLSTFLATFPGLDRPSAQWMAIFTFWWESNPAFVPCVKRGWIVVENNAVVGFLGVIPTLFQLDGVDTVAYNTTTWWVDPAFRPLASPLLLQALQAAKRTVLFNTTPTPALVAMLQLLQFTPIFAKAGVRHYYHLRPLALLLKKIAFKWPARPAFAPASPRVLAWRPGADLLVKELDHADAGFDELWRTTRAEFAYTNVRSAAVLNWYCFGHPTMAKKLIALYRHGQLAGFAIAVLSTGPLPTLTCLDLWTQAGDRAAIRTLSRALIKSGRLAHCPVVILPAFHASLDKVWRRCWLWRRVRRPLYYLKAVSALATQLHSDSAFFCYLQGDVGLG